MFYGGIFLLLVGVLCFFAVGMELSEKIGGGKISWKFLGIYAIAGLSFLSIGTGLVSVDQRSKMNGRPATIELAGDEIWKVKSQVLVYDEYNVVVLQNGEGKVLCVWIKEKLPDDAVFVKAEWWHGEKTLSPVSK